MPEGPGPGPYAQAAREPSGWYLEVVSDWFLPRQDWPVDELALRRSGWIAPQNEGENWYRWEPEATDVDGLGMTLLAGLVEGRPCICAGEFQVTTGRFPSGPHDGEPVPATDWAWAA